MGADNNVTTSTTTLPTGVTNAVNTAAQGALNVYGMNNPVAGMTQPVAGLNDWQNSAANTMSNVSGYRPQMVGTGYTPQQVSAGSVTQFGSPYVSGDQIQSQMNPYTSSVIGTSLDELNRQLAKTNQTSSGQAAMAGAFGGDRAAIVNSENNRNANQIAAQTIAGLNSSNYTQASAAAQQNATRALQAGTSQAQLGANVDEANQYAGLQAANLDSTNQRANQSAGLAGQSLNLSAAGQLANTGAQFRQASQDQLNSIYQQQYRDAMYPQTQVTNLSGVLGTLSGASPKTTTSTSPGTSTTGQLAGLGTAALGLNSLVPGGLAAGVKGLFGSGTDAAGSLDAAGLGGTLAGSSLNLGGVDAPASAFNNLDFSNVGDLSGVFARGGIVGYADGGYVGSGGPWDFSSWSKRAAHTAPPSDTYAPVSAPDYGPANATGDYADGYNPVPAGNGATANLNSAPGADNANMSAAVNQALAVDPATMVTGTPQDNASEDRSIPLDQMPAPAPDASPQAGLGAAAAPIVVSGSSPNSRITQSANPSAPIPTGSVGPAMPAAPAAPAGQSQVGMALLAAGLGMMASKSHTALGAIGEGGLAGVQNLQAQKQMELDQQRLQNQSAYQNALIGVRGQVANTGAQRVANSYDLGTQRNQNAALATDGRNQHYTNVDSNAATRNANTADYQNGRLDQNDDRLAQNDRRLDQGDQRLTAQRQQLTNTQDWRAFQQQSKANDQEINAARSVMFNATNLGKPMSMDQALGQVRSARSSAGPAPIAGQPIAGGTSGGGVPAGPVRVSSVAEAMALPSGTSFIRPDGSVMVRH